MICSDLRSVHLHITEACEHHCGFCYASFGLGKFGHAELEDVKKIVSLAVKAGARNLSLVGGDPVLHPKIAEILRYISETTEMNTILMTNTARFPNNTIAELAPFIDVVMVTIHGDSPIQHDTVSTIVGSYDDLISSCKEFQNHGVQINIAYNITPYTYSNIISSLEALLKKGIDVKRYVFQRIAPIADVSGNILKYNKEYIPKKEQVNAALSQIMTVKEKYGIPIELVDPFPLCIVDKQYRQLITPCKCGLTDLSMNGIGAVTRCGADPNYQLGNVLFSQSENPILDLWQNAPELSFIREREYLSESCRTCEDVWLCGGGCPVAYTVFSANDRNYLDLFD